MTRIDPAHLLRAVGDEAWRAIDRSMQAGATVEDVLTAVMVVNVAIATERRFGDWRAEICDVYRTYLGSLAVRLQEIDTGDSALAQAAAIAIGRVRDACDE